MSCLVGQHREAAMVRTVLMVAGFTTGENISPKSTPACYVNPHTTQRAL